MRLIGNIIWFCLGGLGLAMAWFLAGIRCMITIVGIPFGIQCMKIAGLSLWPFDKNISYQKFGFGSLIGNILWIIIFGWGLAFANLLLGLFYCITIIGIPFGLQCFKMAQLSLFPFGATFE